MESKTMKHIADTAGDEPDPRRIVAFDFCPYHNGADMFADAHEPNVRKRLSIVWPPEVRVCPRCGLFLRPDFTNYDMKLNAKGRRLDLASTYDHREIAKHTFKSMCEELNFTGVAFKELSREPGFFHMVCTAFVPLDIKKMPYVRHGKRCKACGQLDWAITGGSPCVISQPLITDFAWTDLLVFDDNTRQPIVIVSPRVKNAFRVRKMRSADFEPVYLSE